MHDRRHDAAVDERDVGQRQIERRKRLIQLGDERRDVALATRRCRPDRTVRSDSQVPNSARLAPRHEKQVAAGRRASAERLVAGVAPGDEVHRLQHRHAASTTPSGVSRRVHAAAGRVDGQARARSRCVRDPSVSRRATPVTRLPSDERRDRLDVVGQHRAVLGGRQREAKTSAGRIRS